MTTPYTQAVLTSKKQRFVEIPEDFRFLKFTPSPSQAPLVASTPSSVTKALQSGIRKLPIVDSSDNVSREDKEKIRLMYKMRKSFLKSTPKDILRSIYEHTEYRCARTKWSIDSGSLYQATALSVRDRMIELWNDTNAHFIEKKPKRVYYLSIEFLIGRLLRSNMLAIGLSDVYTEALNEIGEKLELIAEKEIDMALGNGGLGRLAACYLDSMASLRLPAWGYGLRYQYGMFKQGIGSGGEQIELPDYWLTDGCPWEIQRNDVKYIVKFFGTVKETKHFSDTVSKQIRKEKVKKKVRDAKGILVTIEEEAEVEIPTMGYAEIRPPTYEWIAEEEVLARAYDVPIVGFNTFNTVNLRLWESIPAREFDFSLFNRGSYDDAVRAKQSAETVTQVLYPNDAFISGKELRLRQQYFFVSATIQDIIRRHYKYYFGEGIPIPKRVTTFGPRNTSSLKVNKEFLESLPNTLMMQCNDTHPVLAIPELLRILIDEYDLTFGEAWPITQKCFSYTNHTILPEALEKWPVDLLSRVLPRHIQIIYQINDVFLNSVKNKFPHLLADLSIIQESPERAIRMANLAIITSTKVNGVAQLHSKLLETTIFSHFYNVFPEKFLNVTNGVTQRRWLLESNPPLAKLYTELSGTTRWTVQYAQLRKIMKNGINTNVINRFLACRQLAKENLARIILEECNVEVDPSALFDVQVKRIHEYKRQTLNILRCIYEYLKLTSLGRNKCRVLDPKVIIFGGKAAPGYALAKQTIKLINCVSRVINADERIEGRLKVIFIPNYNVSLAQAIIPAADISQHISTAGYEASGTSCMKFCMNGARLLGTYDGANIEIQQEIGEDQCYLFGVKSDDVAATRAYRNSGDFELDNRLEITLKQIEEGVFGDPSEFSTIVDNVRNHDFYLVASDFPDYLNTHEKIMQDWKNREEWGRRALLTSIQMEKFSSDRSIIDYSQKIWGVKPCIVPTPISEGQVPDPDSSK